MDLDVFVLGMMMCQSRDDFFVKWKGKKLGILRKFWGKIKRKNGNGLAKTNWMSKQIGNACIIVGLGLCEGNEWWLYFYFFGKFIWVFREIIEK